MDHEFDDDLELNPERRSRKNPKKLDKPVISRAEDGATFVSRQTAATSDDDDMLGGALGGSSTMGNTRGESSRIGSSRNDSQRDGGSRTGSSRDGGPRKNDAIARRKQKRRRMIAMIIAECFALVFIFGYGFVARMAARIQRPQSFEISEIKTNEDIAVEAVENMKGYWTIAVFGVDARDNAITKSTNADVNLICNINLETGEIKLVSVFRDTYLNISENGTYNKINQAYFTGGPEQAIQALNRNLDLNITDYVTFNWKAVANGIDVLGGVDIELSRAEFYYINSFITETVKATGIGSHQLTHAGMNHLDGVQAVAYGRLRLMDTDYARTERQRKVIAQAFEKAKQADFQTLYTLIGTVFPQVSTSLWVDDLVNNARNINKFHLGETTGFPQARGDANMGKKGAVVVPQTLESNVVKLHEFLFGDEDYTPSSTVQRLSSRIAADTGMYREGQYVDRVSTEGGVIQPPKTSAATSTDDEDETDEDESDADELDMDELDETDGYGRPINPVDGPEVTPTAAETDENGDPVETLRPGAPTTSTTGAGSTYPTSPTTASRPGANTGTTQATTGSQQGVVDRPGGGTTPTTADGGPGSSAPTAATTAASTTAANNMAPTAATTAPTTAANNMAPTAATTAPTTAANNMAPTAATTAPTTAANNMAPTAATTAAAAPTAAAATTAAGLSGGPGSGDVTVVPAPGQ